MNTIETEKSQKTLSEITDRAHRDGMATIETRQGVGKAPKLTALRGSARGCYGDAAQYVDRLRDEWQGGTRSARRFPGQT